MKNFEKKKKCEWNNVVPYKVENTGDTGGGKFKKTKFKKKTKNEMAAAVGGEYYVPLQNTGWVRSFNRSMS